MNLPRPQPFYITQHRADGVTVLVRVVQARSRAEAIAIYCRSRS